MKKRLVLFVLAITSVIATLAACGHAMMTHASGVERPAPSEFGPGPRSSAEGRYVATLDAAGPLRPRRMLTVRVALHDAQGNAVEGAQISIDGGMPEHGHGLPTRPRVKGSLGGVYEIEGVRFNMGGWWELRLEIAGPRGADTVTFNLDI